MPRATILSASSGKERCNAFASHPMALTSIRPFLVCRIERRDVVVLHGDMHHENILKFSSRGWLAIDPKGLVGERGFDYANIFCKPRQRDRDHARPLSAANTSGSRGRGIGTQSAAGVESGLGRFVCGI
jgi:hypothetical protein